MPTKTSTLRMIFCLRLAVVLQLAERTSAFRDTEVTSLDLDSEDSALRRAEQGRRVTRHVLGKGQTLHQGQSLQSNNGKYRLLMQDDCDLVGYEGTRAFWWSRTAGNGQGCQATMQNDGNFVIHDKHGKTVFQTHTAGKGREIRMQDDRNICVYDGWCSFSHVGNPQVRRDVLPKARRQHAQQDTLEQGQSLWSKNGKYRLLMQEDCDLVGYEGTRAFWWSRTAGNGQGCKATMQGDGNFVIYDRRGKPVFHTNTVGKGREIHMQDDRNICVYDGWCSYSHVGNPQVRRDVLPKGSGEHRQEDTLGQGQSLWSNNGKYRLVMQDDCDLVGYEGARAFWWSRTAGNGQGCYATMQGDGNFVIYDRRGKPVFHTNTAGKGREIHMQDDRNICVHDGWCSYSHVGNPQVRRDVLPKASAHKQENTLDRTQSLWSNNGKYRLVMQEDCNLVGYEGTRVFWSSKTAGKGQGCKATMKGDGNFVIHDKHGKTVFQTNTAGKGREIRMQDDQNICVYDGWCSQVTELAEELEGKVANLANTYFKHLQAGGKLDKKRLEELVTQMDDIMADFALDTPPDWFTSRVGVRTPTSGETAECLLRINSMNRLLWDKFKSYGSWAGKTKHEASPAATKTERTFRILESLNSFALWMVQPFLDDTQHGPQGAPNQTVRTPNLWAGFNSECQNKYGRTSQEELDSFQILTNSYSVDHGTHCGDVLNAEEVTYLHECTWSVRQKFWETRSKDFVLGIPSQGADTIFVSLNKKSLDEAFGLKQSMLWEVQLPTLGGIYGEPSAMHEGQKWRPRIRIFETTQSCEEKGLTVAKELRRNIRKKRRKHLEIECFQCGDALSRCLNDGSVSVRHFRFNTERKVMEESLHQEKETGEPDSPTSPAEVAETVVRSQREEAAVDMATKELDGPDQIAKMETQVAVQAHSSDAVQPVGRAETAHDDLDKQCSDTRDLDVGGGFLNMGNSDEENGRCPDHSRRKGRGNCTCYKNMVFSNKCDKYVLMTTMPEPAHRLVSCQCVPDPRISDYLKTHVAAMDFCAELVKAVYEKHAVPNFSGSIRKAAQEVEDDMKRSVAERACEAALAKAESPSEAVGQITHEAGDGEVPDIRKGPRAKQLFDSAALALKHVCRDECHSLVARMTTNASEDSSLARLAERTATGRPLQEQCAETVVKQVEGELLGCCARSCGWDGDSCALWAYMDNTDQSNWQAECCTEYNILRGSSRERMCNSVLSPQKASQMAAASEDNKQGQQGDADRVGQDAETVGDGGSGSGFLQLRLGEAKCSEIGSCSASLKVPHWKACAKEWDFAILVVTKKYLFPKLLNSTIGKMDLQGCAARAKEHASQAHLWTSSAEGFFCYELGNIGKDAIQTCHTEKKKKCGTFLEDLGKLNEGHMHNPIALVRLPAAATAAKPWK